MRQTPKLTPKPLLVLRGIVELYIPAASFVIMFLVFILQIFCRYVLRAPVTWAYEITVSCYLWLVVLGACYAQRDRSHVCFTLLYDKLPLRMKALTAFLGNAIIAFAFIASFIPSWQFIAFMQKQVTSVLKIGLNVIYAPYIPFLALMILYAISDMWREARVFLNIATEEEKQAFLGEAKAEYEAAVEAALEEVQV